MMLAVHAGGWRPSKRSRSLTPPLMLCTWPRLLRRQEQSDASGRGCDAHRDCNCSRDGLPLDVGNCAHIANATMRTRIETICRGEGYEPPILCTPEELMED